MKNRLITTIFLALFLAIASAYIFFPEVEVVYNGTLYLAFPVGAALVALYTSRIYGFKSANGQALLLITAGLVLWGIGETITYVRYITDTSIFPSMADYTLLLAYSIFAAGIYRGFITSGVKLKQVNKSLLTVVLSASVILTILVAYFGVYQAFDPEVDLLSNIVAISYGLVDLVLVILSLIAILVASEYKGGKLASFWGTIALGFFMFLVADILFAMHGNQWSEDITNPYDIFIQITWATGYLTLAYGMMENYLHISEVQNKIKLMIQKRNNPVEA